MFKRFSFSFFFVLVSFIRFSKFTTIISHARAARVGDAPFPPPFFKPPLRCAALCCAVLRCAALRRAPSSAQVRGILGVV